MRGGGRRTAQRGDAGATDRSAARTLCEYLNRSSQSDGWDERDRGHEPPIARTHVPTWERPARGLQ
ncbi:hypothetical protein GCM10023100_02160 [Actinocorallia cavernae]|uniref:Uncharacterized protein n=2 Tax=Actinomycetes TaxID=1760 RepID=A0ABP5ZCM2_9ACTN